MPDAADAPLRQVRHCLRRRHDDAAMMPLLMFDISHTP